MKLVIVNHSDNRGGAAIAAVRLMEALIARGVDARMLVVHRDLASDNIRQLTPAWRAKACFIDEHVNILMHNGFSRQTLFKISIANCGMDISNHPWIKEADIVNLHWVNQGVVSLQEIARIKAPVIWTMHDMWCLTGICHHAGECIGFMSRCGNCNLLGSHSANDDLSRKTLQRKEELYNKKNIEFVAVSHWLAARAGRSSLLRSRRVQVIPNAFPADKFTTEAVRGRAAYGLPPDRPLVLMGAARLDDPIKGLDIAIEALNKLTDTPAVAVFFGNLRDKHALDDLRLPYVHLGQITDPQMLTDIYAHADVVISTSHYETLPTTLIEGMAAGCIPVAFDRGGQRDIIDHMSTGYMATYPDAANISDGIRYALTSGIDRKAMRQKIIDRFSPDAVADKYIALSNTLLGLK